mmetsp:Transcript_15901/g.33647  ORF Transcript_15901/g.33647 Transcript_15901/m.33647 type:complete len:220 (-) Transcript_15901:149-808(-)
MLCVRERSANVCLERTWAARVRATFTKAFLGIIQHLIIVALVALPTIMSIRKMCANTELKLEMKQAVLVMRTSTNASSKQILHPKPKALPTATVISTRRALSHPPTTMTTPIPSHCTTLISQMAPCVAMILLISPASTPYLTSTCLNLLKDVAKYGGQTMSMIVRLRHCPRLHKPALYLEIMKMFPHPPTWIQSHCRTIEMIHKHQPPPPNLLFLLRFH